MKKLIVLLVLFSIGVQGQVWDREYWVSFTYKAAKGQEAAFGLKVTQGAPKAFQLILQAYILKHLMFEGRNSKRAKY